MTATEQIVRDGLTLQQFLRRVSHKRFEHDGQTQRPNPAQWRCARAATAVQPDDPRASEASRECGRRDRAQEATQRKLDEILRASPNADNSLITLEEAPDNELKAATDAHRDARRDARREGPS